MKKLIKQSLILGCLLTLSISAFLYVNLKATQSVSDKDEIKVEEQRMEEKTESEVTFIEVEFLKKLLRQGVSRLPISKI
ncbi:MAG: hypothetical protein HC803_08350 [Saprospiraceae bacterium]|nr:hypothetical protein [Saprospiraceae bacterium]